jgi:molybdopterin-binding protein
VRLSTRNEFVGTITRLVRGPVSTEVTVRIADGVEIVSVITRYSARRLKLKKGQLAHAFIKADHVIVGVDQVCGTWACAGEITVVIIVPY